MTTAFDNALALGFIGAAANGTREPMENRHAAGQARSGEGSGHDSGSSGRPRDAESATLYLRTCDVRAVRRETRAGPTGDQSPVVVVDFVASDESIDSHDSIVTCDFDLRRFEKNPVLLWAHNRDKDHLPIGRCENTRIESKTLLSTAVFFMRTEHQKDIAEAYARGECRMFSVGFYPDTYEIKEIDGEEILVLSNNQLIEISAVPVGSNENALAKAALHAVRERARANKTPSTPDTTSPRATAPTAKPGAPKEQTMKTLKIDAREIRADKGASCKAMCPNCNEDMMVNLDLGPMPDEKTVADLTTRATTAEGKIAEVERALALANQEKTAAEKRADALEKRAADAESLVEQHRVALATSEIDKRCGTKIEPAERDAEIEIAKTLLANTTPDPEKPGSTLGEKALAARLAKIDSRRDLGLLGGPITGGDQKSNTGATAAPETRNLAAEIDKIVAAQPAN